MRSNIQLDIWPGYPRRKGQNPSLDIHTYADPVRPNNTSNVLKRHWQTFYLGRRDPGRWEKGRNATVSANLHEARERTQNVGGGS